MYPPGSRLLIYFTKHTKIYHKIGFLLFEGVVYIDAKNEKKLKKLGTRNSEVPSFTTYSILHVSNLIPFIKVLQSE
jgi:hypothetical protein